MTEGKAAFANCPMQKYQWGLASKPNMTGGHEIGVSNATGEVVRPSQPQDPTGKNVHT